MIAWYRAPLKTSYTQKLYGDVLTIADVSWNLERILELVSIPNVVVTSGKSDQYIINLHKRK